MEAPGTSPAFYPVIDGGAANEEGVISEVDPFLVEVLENPRHRLTVLRMELDIQRFMQNPDQYQFEFQQFPTSYLRRAAHRVAQHYGLQTMALDNNLDGLSNRIIAMKTPDSRFPAVCLSEVPAKQHEKEMSERVKIAVRPRPGKGLPGDATELGIKTSRARTVEERKEEYDKARARIFSGYSSPEMEGSGTMPSADVRSSCSTGDEQEFDGTHEESEKIGTKDGASRVAIFRDREKDRIDPDYDRNYDRYARGLAPSQNFRLGGCSVLRPPFLQYEAGFSQMSQLPGSAALLSQRPPSNLAMNHPFCAFGPNQTTSKGGTVFMQQWPSSPAMVFADPYDHFQHAIFQVPFYQQPLSSEHS